MENIPSKTKETRYIKCDGSLISSDGMERLKKGGMKGFNHFMDNCKQALGGWNRVVKPLDKDAAETLRLIRNPVERGLRLSKAISAEKGISKATERPCADEKGVFMRLTLSDAANGIVSAMTNAEFRAFVSSAILRHKKTIIKKG